MRDPRWVVAEAGLASENDETWLDLELLATRIYAELAPGCQVRHDVRIVGTLSEAPRQIDVLIEDPSAGTRVVVDCKDRSRRVTVTDAGSFAGLLEDVEATAGVLICNRGFSKATATYARKKGFQLAGLHDVASRKWRLDVQVPIVWKRLRLAPDLRFSVLAHFEKGQVVETDRVPRFRREGRDVDPAVMFGEMWNSGELHGGRPGEGELSTVLDYETSPGMFARDATVTISFRVVGEAGLGYVTPIDARGILDSGTGAFTAASLDLMRTVDQTPEGGWQPIYDPDELAVRHMGTVVTKVETVTGEVQLSGVTYLRGASPHNRDFRWERPG